jgi:heme/copper-type cytochrome/quinol oxidase subunit 4
MNRTDTTPHKQRNFWKRGLISFALLAFTWLTVISWWQVTQRAVTQDDVIVYLIVLPTVALMLLIVSRFLHQILQQRKSVKSSAVQSSTLRNTDALQEDIDLVAERPLALPVLGAWAISSAGHDAHEFIQALDEKRKRPVPDEHLTDEQGFPLLTGRVGDLDIVAAKELLTEAITMIDLENIPDPEEWRSAFIRVLALLGSVLDQIQDEWPFIHEDTEDRDFDREYMSGTLTGAMPKAPASCERLRMSIKLFVPARFLPYEQQLVRIYLLKRLDTLLPQQQPLDLDVIPAEDDATALALADEFNVHTHRADAPCALLLLACDSALCTTVTDEWQVRGQLFGERHPNGLMAAEAAFGVLCANSSASTNSTAKPVCQLTRTSRTYRDSSADTQGKPSYQCLTHTISNALLTAGIAGEQIGTVACDADHRPNRNLECMGAMMEQTPQLDAIQNRITANEACGHLGTASVLGILVAGIMRSKTARHPVLLFNVGHMHDRAAAILIPSNETLP